EGRRPDRDRDHPRCDRGGLVVPRGPAGAGDAVAGLQLPVHGAAGDQPGAARAHRRLDAPGLIDVLARDEPAGDQRECRATSGGARGPQAGHPAGPRDRSGPSDRPPRPAARNRSPRLSDSVPYRADPGTESDNSALRPAQGRMRTSRRAQPPWTAAREATNAWTAVSMSSSVWAAESCTRNRALSFGTTG